MSGDGEDSGDGGARDPFAAVLHGAQRPLHPSAVTLWRIDGALSLLVFGPTTVALAFGILAARAAGTPADPSFATAVLIGLVVLAPLVFFRIVVVPPLLHRRWRWRLTPDHLHLQRGLWTERRTIVPLVRVQNVDTIQGPIARRFGLWSVVVATAAHPQSIPFLAEDEAEALRAAIAELARRAREEG